MRFLICVAIAIAPAASFADRIDDVARKWMSEKRIPGMLIAVEDGGKVRYRTYGLAQIEHGIPIRKDTVFEYASISKGLYATAVMKLVEEGKLSLDDPVGKHLDGAPESWSALKVRHLLTHSHTLPELTTLIKLSRLTTPLARYSAKMQLEDLFASKPSGEPGAKFSYTNTGIFLVGQILGKLKQSTAAEAVRQSVFIPAGMKSTFLDPDSVVPRKAEGYTIRKNMVVRFSLNNALRQLDDTAFANVVGTADDLLAYGRAFRSRSLLKAPTVEQMLTSGLKTPSGSSVGMGWVVRDYPQGRAIGHEGHTGTAYVSFVDRPTTVVILTNLSEGYGFPFGSDQGFSPRALMEEMLPLLVPK